MSSAWCHRRADLRRHRRRRLLLGENFLDYSVLAHDPAHGQQLGIFLVEAGVAITVSGVMLTIFSCSPSGGAMNTA